MSAVGSDLLMGFTKRRPAQLREELLVNRGSAASCDICISKDMAEIEESHQSRTCTYHHQGTN